MPATDTGAAFSAHASSVGVLPRVLHLRSSSGLYGAEGVIRGLARTYRGPCRVLCLADARAPHTELCDLLTSEGLDAGMLPSRGAIDPVLVLRFAAAMRRYRPDIVHTHDYKSDTIAWLANLLSGCRAKLVATMHGVVRTSAALRGYEQLDARVLRRYNAVVAVSNDTSKTAASYGIRSERIHLISNGVDTERFQPRDGSPARVALGLPPNGPLVGVVGRLSPEKGQDILLDAWKRIAPTAHLAVVGDGPMEASLRADAGPNVHFLGRREDMPRVFSALDLLAMPSLTEGMPLTLLEAAACGVPAVASDVGDVGLVTRTGETGTLVPPGDGAALAAALAAMLSDLHKLSAMGVAARNLVAGRFSEAATSDAYTQLYQALAGAGGPAR